MKFAIVTLGCKVNLYQSEGMSAALTRNGHTRVTDHAAADTILVNTCAVTGRAAGKSRQLIRRLKRENPEARIVAAGCLTAADSASLATLEAADMVLAYHDKHRIAEALAAPGAADVLTPADPFCLTVPEPVNRTRGLVMVQDGCEARCSYCILPRIRGPYRSRPLDAILAETRLQAEAGCPEIVITGIHTGAYGRDLTEDLTLADVIEAVLALPGTFRVRLSSIEIGEVSPRLAAMMRDNPRFCAHLPLPLQSGSDRILKLMNRTYTADEFCRRAVELQAQIPDTALTTDIICGFPSESDADFEATLAVIERAGFARLHVFGYSPRPGTPAAAMSGRVPARIITARVRALQARGRERVQAFARRFIGCTLKVIPEQFDPETGLLTGYAANYISVAFIGPEQMQGRIVEVKGVRVQGEMLEAEAV